MVNGPKDKKIEGTHKYLTPDAERDISPEDLAKMDKETQIEIMETWFYQHYEDPVQHTPYDEDEYVFIWGGPYDALEELMAEFEGIIPIAVIEKLAGKLYSICPGWSGKAWADEEAGRFVFGIEENALSSLKHGVEHFIAKETDENENIKFAIIHIFHALELFLKARLAKAHRLLIYSKPECAINDDAHTVDFKMLICRLNNIAVNVSINELEPLRKIRNCIEHHQIEADKEEVKQYIGRVARFLDKFLGEELGINLKQKLPGNLYVTLSQAIYSYEERIKKAKEEAEKYVAQNKGYAIESCPECLNITLTTPTLEYGPAHCFLCDKDFYPQQCLKCGTTMLKSQILGQCDMCDGELMSNN
ncbi:MAG: hypothetical protein WC980_06810 [Candidatus Brocadiia bacterium]